MTHDEVVDGLAHLASSDSNVHVCVESPAAVARLTGALSLIDRTANAACFAVSPRGAETHAFAGGLVDMLLDRSKFSSARGDATVQIVYPAETFAEEF